MGVFLRRRRSGLLAEPAYIFGHLARRNIDKPRALPKESQHVAVEHQPVVITRALAKPSPTSPLVALDPIAGVVVERDSRTLLKLTTSYVGNPYCLGAPSLVKCSEALGPFDFAVELVDVCVDATPLVYAGCASF